MEIKQTRDTLSTTYFDALSIRNAVFVKEQGVPYALEMESPKDEAQAVHFVLYNGGKALATVRLLGNVVQRMAVLAEARGKGYANVLLEEVFRFARQSGLNELLLHAQLSAQGLYARHGFKPEGEIFEEAGIQHITMKKSLK